MGNFGLNGGVPWLVNTAGSVCFICKENIEDVGHFFFECPEFKTNFESIWVNLRLKILSANPTDGSQISNFINHLDRHQKTLLLLGGLKLPFDQFTALMITRFICSAVSKVYNVRKEKLRELEAPWLSN